MLDGDHKALVEAVLPVCSRYGLGVAGGYAVKAYGLVERPSEDIDFATGTAAPVGDIVDALAAAYRAAGFTAEVLDADGRKGHLLATFPLDETYLPRGRAEGAAEPPGRVDGVRPGDRPCGRGRAEDGGASRPGVAARSA